MHKSDQISSAKFLVKYGGLDLYDEYVKKRYIIGHEGIQNFRK